MRAATDAGLVSCCSLSNWNWRPPWVEGTGQGEARSWLPVRTALICTDPQTRYGPQATRGLSSDEKYPILADVLHWHQSVAKRRMGRFDKGRRRGRSLVLQSP